MQHCKYSPRTFAAVAVAVGVAASTANARAEPPAEVPAIRIVPGLEEPLVRTWPTSRAEDLALEDALARFAAPTSTPSTDLAVLEPLVGFVQAHPHSGWSVALLTNLGGADYHAGYFSRALDSWRRAWRDGRRATDPRARALVDKAVGEFARMHARLGHARELEQLFDELGSRQVTGPATETITGAREGARVMRSDPGMAYLCGPKALENLMIALARPPNTFAFLDQERSGPHGFSLAQLSALATRAGMAHRLIHRKPGQAIPVPSLINWSVHHFAAIVGERDGRFRIIDPTFGVGGDELWVRADAIDAESTGFFLIPADQPLAPGWRMVTTGEARGVFGMGFTSVSQPGATTPNDHTIAPPCPGKGMCRVNAHTMLVSATLNDVPVGVKPPKGPPVEVRLTYIQREANQPATFPYFNVGPKWTLNFLSLIVDSPASPGVGVMRYVAGGGSVSYPTNGGPFDPASGAFAPEAQTQAVLVRIPARGPVAAYELRMPDGSKQVFALADGATTAPRRVFLTQIVDPVGNALTLGYDDQLRLLTITDATGGITRLSYELADRPLLVTRITDPFGRAATIAYDATGRLTSITDVIGLTSTVAYDAAGLVNALTTPYGTTSLSYGQNPGANSRFLEIVDPMGFARRLEFVHQAPGIPGADPVAPPGSANTFLQFRNSFSWNEHELLLARPSGQPIDYTKAQLFHWLHTAASQTSPVLESMKNPLENRVWYSYPGQTSALREGNLDLPSSIARVLDDKSNQISHATYNSLGKPLTTTDARGRITIYTYDANGIDLLMVQQQTSRGPPASTATLATISYNAQHLPLSFTDAAGQTTAFAYSESGQLVRATDPRGHVTSYQYDRRGRLTAIMAPDGTVVLAITYDPYDRVATRTDSVGHVIAYEYDALDRLTRTVYPDGTFEQYTYDKLDLVSATDRRGDTTRYTHDANRRLTSVTDALNRTTKLEYFENGSLKALTDPRGQTTRWEIDLQGRPTVKHYPDGTTETVDYEATTSRVAAMIDALGQSAVYSYNVDDRLAGIAYANTVQPMAPVKFQHDESFPRLVAMTDGIGVTSFTYYPVDNPPALGANRLRSVQSPVAGSPGATDTVVYTYDELGQTRSETLNGIPRTVSYDATGRVTEVSNPLDTFTYHYDDATARLTAVASNQGPRLQFGYYGSEGDELLKQMTATLDGTQSPLLQLGYTYDSSHNITTISRSPTATAQQVSAAAGTTPARAGGPWWAGALAMLAMTVLAAFAALGKFRRRGIRIAAAATALLYFLSCGDSKPGSTSGPEPEVTSYGYSDTNQVVSAWVSTASDRPGSPQYAYGYDEASNLGSITRNGATTIVGHGETNAITDAVYDANGSPTDLDGAHYVWDGANRLITASKDGIDSSFTYDGFGRLVRIVEKRGDTIVSDRAYTWCGTSRCLQHDNLRARSPVSKQYFSEGVVAGDERLYYVRDHLGSVLQLVDTSGAPRAEYQYDPYGNPTKVGGDLDSDIGYAGYFHHAPTGLAFTLSRAYDPSRGSWLSRDAIGEKGGVNLYEYASSNPVNFSDPTGNCPLCVAIAIGALTNAAIDVAAQFLTNGGHIQCVDWGEVGMSAAIGAALPGLEGLGSLFFKDTVGTVVNGGIGPVEQGAAGVARTIAEIEAAGGKILGKEITIEAGSIRTRPDLFVELPNGESVFVEVKTGPSATLTANQEQAFPHIWTEGGIPRGQNARAAGLMPGVPIGPKPVWIVRQPWPLP